MKRRGHHPQRVARGSGVRGQKGGEAFGMRVEVDNSLPPGTLGMRGSDGRTEWREFKRPTRWQRFKWQMSAWLNRRHGRDRRVVAPGRKGGKK